MSVITRRLSVPELSQQILEMAKTGVYRESVFEALSPLGTKKQIREAIAHAKRFGLHSVASLRDTELGTYYQVDLVKYELLQQAILSPVDPSPPANAAQTGRAAVKVTAEGIQRLLAAAKDLSIVLTTLGVICTLTGWGSLGLGFLSGAASAAGVWAVQRAIAKNVFGE